jgi:hypothetical protein
MGWAGLLFVGKDGFDGAAEEAGKFEGERKAGIELPSLDGVDGLTGDLEFLGEVGLGPVAFGAEDAKAVFHWLLLRWKRRASIETMRKMST